MNGLTITPEGYLSFQPIRQSVPPLFWTRVREAADSAGLGAELAADYKRRREAVREERIQNSWWGANEEMELENDMFRTWVLSLFGNPGMWPWDLGWTSAKVETYLVKS
jgi:hypothetical protein